MAHEEKEKEPTDEQFFTKKKHLTPGTHGSVYGTTCRKNTFTERTPGIENNKKKKKPTDEI